MTEQEIKDWLGVGDSPRSLRPEIITGMRDVPRPEGKAEEMNAFAAFLRCVPTQDGGVRDVRIFESSEAVPVHVTLVASARCPGWEVRHDGVTVWEGGLLDYFRTAAPRGVPVILDTEVRD
jgi:hypothetical protein